MKEVRILEIKQSVFADNDRQAQLLRQELLEKKLFLLNLMSSPGSGKTTTLMRTIEALRDTSWGRILIPTWMPERSPSPA